MASTTYDIRIDEKQRALLQRAVKLLARHKGVLDLPASGLQELDMLARMLESKGHEFGRLRRTAEGLNDFTL